LKGSFYKEDGMGENCPMKPFDIKLGCAFDYYLIILMWTYYFEQEAVACCKNLVK